MHWIIDTFYLHADRVILTMALLALPFIYVEARKHRLAARRAASELGLTSLSKRQFLKYIDKSKYSCLNPKVAGVQLSDIFKGSFGGFQICIFLIMPPGRRSGIGNTAIHVKFDSAKLPKFIIRLDTVTDELFAMFGHHNKNIDFSGQIRFTDQYVVRGDDEMAIRALLNPSVINVLSQIDRLCIESLGSEIIIYKDYSMAEPNQYRSYITRSINLLKMLLSLEFDSQLPSEFTDKEPAEVKERKLKTAIKYNPIINFAFIFVFLFGHGGSLGKIFSFFFVIESFAIHLFLRWQLRLLTEEARHRIKEES